MSEAKKKKQKTIQACSLLGFLVILVGISFWPENRKDTHHPPPSGYTDQAFPHEDARFSAEKIRLSRLEQNNTSLSEDLSRLELSLQQIKEDNQLLESKNKQLTSEQNIQNQHILSLQEKKEKPSIKTEEQQESHSAVEVQVWSKPSLLSKRNVDLEIPAGTVVKCLLVSSADCSVGINTASDPNTVLLQPIANGKLPKKVQVALKGSRIIGTAVGDIASERVRIRTERLTLMLGRNGDFIETSIAGFVSGEDGKEGLRGIVVDRSGAIISRAAFASFLQGVGQSI